MSCMQLHGQRITEYVLLILGAYYGQQQRDASSLMGPSLRLAQV